MRVILATMFAVGLAAATASCAPAALEEQKIVAIDKVSIGSNQEFRINGKPFLPIMSWAQAPKTFPLLRQCGMNTFTGNQSDVTPLEQCKAAEKAGGYAVPGFGKEAIGHPSLLAWIHGDEPDMPRKQADGSNAPKNPIKNVEAKFREIKAADTTRPVFVTFTSQFMKEHVGKYTEAMQKAIYPAYVRFCDVAGFDEYPIYGSGHASHLNWPAYGVTQLRQIAGPKRPIYVWIETHKGSRWMTFEKQPDVLPKHTRFEVWGCLIRGATAIGYFTHRWRPDSKEFAPTPEMQAELKRLNGQLSRLAPAILADPAKQKITMKIDSDYECHFKATQYGGQLYLFAQNQDLGPNAEKLGQFDPISPRGGKATFTIAGLKAGTKIEVIDEDRTLTAGDGTFADEFGPLAEHVYSIGM